MGFASLLNRRRVRAALVEDVPEGEGIALQRSNEFDSPYFCNAIWLAPGQLTESQLSDGYGVLTNDGAEVAVLATALNHVRHEDGSLREVHLQGDWSDVETGTLFFRNDLQRTLSAPSAIPICDPQTDGANNTLTFGWLVPSDPVHLCASHAGYEPLVPYSALDTQEQAWFAHFDTAFENTKGQILDAAYDGVNSDWVKMGFFPAIYMPHLVLLQAYCMTGDLKYLRAGNKAAWVYAIGNVGDHGSVTAVNPEGVNYPVTDFLGYLEQFKFFNAIGSAAWYAFTGWEYHRVVCGNQAWSPMGINDTYEKAALRNNYSGDGWSVVGDRGRTSCGLINAPWVASYLVRWNTTISYASSDRWNYVTKLPWIYDASYDNRFNRGNYADGFEALTTDNLQNVGGGNGARTWQAAYANDFLNLMELNVLARGSEWVAKDTFNASVFQKNTRVATTGDDNYSAPAAPQYGLTYDPILNEGDISSTQVQCWLMGTAQGVFARASYRAGRSGPFETLYRESQRPANHDGLSESDIREMYEIHYRTMPAFAYARGVTWTGPSTITNPS